MCATSCATRSTSSIALGGFLNNISGPNSEGLLQFGVRLRNGFIGLAGLVIRTWFGLRQAAASLRVGPGVTIYRGASVSNDRLFCLSKELDVHRLVGSGALLLHVVRDLIPVCKGYASRGTL